MTHGGHFHKSSRFIGLTIPLASRIMQHNQGASTPSWARVYRNYTKSNKFSVVPAIASAGGICDTVYKPLFIFYTILLTMTRQAVRISPLYPFILPAPRVLVTRDLTLRLSDFLQPKRHCSGDFFAFARLRKEQIRLSMARHPVPDISWESNK
jgi:hypothetical protein